MKPERWRTLEDKSVKFNEYIYDIFTLTIAFQSKGAKY